MATNKLAAEGPLAVNQRPAFISDAKGEKNTFLHSSVFMKHQLLIHGISKCTPKLIHHSFVVSWSDLRGLISWIPTKKYLWNCYSGSTQQLMELGGSEANHVKADPDRDSTVASPHWASNRLMWSTINTLSCLENMEKSGFLYLLGRGTWSKYSG